MTEYESHKYNIVAFILHFIDLAQIQICIPYKIWLIIIINLTSKMCVKANDNCFSFFGRMIWGINKENNDNKRHIQE